LANHEENKLEKQNRNKLTSGCCVPARRWPRGVSASQVVSKTWSLEVSTTAPSTKPSVQTRLLLETMEVTEHVGTLKLGYPLLLYKDAVPMRLSLSRVVRVLRVGPSHDSPQPRTTTLGPQQRLTPPHGRVQSCHVSREIDRPQGLNSESGPPWESAGPLDIQSGPPRLVQDHHVCKPDPYNGIRTPPPPPVWGPGRPQWGPKVPGQNILVP
jgi:hypothetical protein